MAHAAPKIEPRQAMGESPAPVEVDLREGTLELGLDDVVGHGETVPHGASEDGATGGEGHEAPEPKSYEDVVRAVGSLVCSWGSLERTTMDKLTAMRLAAGDVRLVGGRMRPGMARLLAELRALVSMRDRHDKQGLVVIADLENHIQRIAQFHLLVISGFQASEADVLLCRDSKNSERRISLADVEREIGMIEMIKERLSAI